MNCNKCFHQYICATRRKFIDVIFQETMVLDVEKSDVTLDVILGAVASVCGQFKPKEVKPIDFSEGLLLKEVKP